MSTIFFLWFVFFTIGLQVFCLYWGRPSAKALQNQTDYFLAGKNLKFFPLTMSFIATQLGGGIILGAAEEAYKIGWYALLYPLGSVIGLVILGLGVGNRLASFKVSTVAQVFEVYYGSTLLKKVASILSIISLFIILVAQVIASAKFMASIAVNSYLLLFSFWAIVIFYTSFGGLKAVVATDIVQAIFFILSFGCCVAYIYFNAEALPVTQNVMPIENSEFSVVTKLSGWLLMPLLFMLIEQDMGQRCFSAVSSKVVTYSTICSAVVILFVCAMPIYLGMLAKYLNIPLNPSESVLMSLMTKLAPQFLSALVASAILVAIISTADSLLNAISSNVSQDFDFFQNRSVATSQKLTLFIAGLAILCSFFFDSIVQLLLVSYELSVSMLFVSIFMALFVKKADKISAYASILTGLVSFIVLNFYETYLPREATTVILSLTAYLLAYSRLILADFLSNLYARL